MDGCRVLASRQRGRGFKPHQYQCIVSLSKNINPSLLLFQPMKTCPLVTERLLMGCKESNQTNKQPKTSKAQRARWHNGRVLDMGFNFRGHWFESQWRHCVVSLSETPLSFFSVLVSTQEKSRHD